MDHLKLKLKNVQRKCKECQRKCFPSQFTSDKARICNSCKLRRDRSFVYGGITFNRSTNKLVGEQRKVILQYKNGTHKTISRKNARQYVKEGFATILDPCTIIEVRTRNELEELVLMRASYSCELCYEKGKHVRMIKPERFGGMWTPLNLHCLCDHCAGEPENIEISELTSIESFTANNDWDFSTKAPKEKLSLYQVERWIRESKYRDRKTKKINKKKTGFIYCDASVYESGKIGVGNVIVTNDSISTSAEVYNIEGERNSIYGELLAILHALTNILNEPKGILSDTRIITILSDYNYISILLKNGSHNHMMNQLIARIKELKLLLEISRSKTIVIKYMGDRMNRSQLYKLAHHTSRTFIHSPNKEGVPLAFAW